jgi:hypothetical protein
VALPLKRAQVEPDVSTRAGTSPYQTFRTGQVWMIIADPGNGSAPTVQTPATVPAVIDPELMFNIGIGGRYALTEQGGWVIHGGFAEDGSPVGPEDTVFAKADLRVVTVGVSGLTKLLPGSVGLRYERGTTGEITLRRLEGLPQFKTRFTLSAIGVVYSVVLLF